MLLSVEREAQNAAHDRGFRVGPLRHVIERALGSRRLLGGREASGPLFKRRAFAFKRVCLRALH